MSLRGRLHKLKVNTTNPLFGSLPTSESTSIRCATGCAGRARSPECTGAFSTFCSLLRLGVDGGEHFGRRHRQLGQPPADGALDRVGDGGHRGADVDFGDAFGAVRMAGI